MREAAPHAGALAYPIDLGADDIARLLPHRGEMLFLRRLKVLKHNQFQGMVQWSATSEMLRGHFPGLPLVPGVMLVEAVAQIAGAGMLAGDPHARSKGSDWIGVLAAIRKCSFRRPVLPDQEVVVEVNCRQMTEAAVTVSGVLRVGGEIAANIEILLIHSPREALEQHFAAASESPA